jgi:hypothetical protein
MSRLIDHNDSEWPKEVSIRKTTEADSDDFEDSMDTIEINSWNEIPDGYEPVLDDKAEIASYDAYLRCQR